MLIDAKASAPSTTLRFLPPPFSDVGPLGAVDRSVAVLANGKESMAVSSAPARLGRYLVKLGQALVVEPAHTAFLDTRLGASLFPAVIDSVGFGIEDAEKERLEFRLRAAFDTDPLEDGISHPAERIVREALQAVDDRSRIFACLRALSVDAEHPGFSASVLRCLSRWRLGTSAWRAEIVRSALAADDVEMRDAAVQAAESWGGPEMRDVLRSHVEVEPTSWLRAYLQDVVEDLGE